MAFWQVLGTGMWEAFKEILKAPFKDLSIWWVLAPVFIFWIVLELYFAKHKSEDLGWNTALGNGISLTWITVNLMRYLFQNKLQNFTWPKFLLVIMIMFYGFFIAYVSFKHKFSGKTTFMLASPSPVYFLSTIAILWAYGTLTIDWYVVLDLIMLYPVLIGLLALIKKYTPDAEEPMSSNSSSDLGDLNL